MGPGGCRVSSFPWQGAGELEEVRPGRLIVCGRGRRVGGGSDFVAGCRGLRQTGNLASQLVRDREDDWTEERGRPPGDEAGSRSGGSLDAVVVVADELAGTLGGGAGGTFHMGDGGLAGLECLAREAFGFGLGGTGRRPGGTRELSEGTAEVPRGRGVSAFGSAFFAHLTVIARRRGEAGQ